MKIIIIVLLILTIFFLFYPLLIEEEYHYDTEGITKIKELKIEKQYLERQLQDLSLDKDSGKISESEWDNLILPIKNKIHDLEEKIQKLQLKGKV